MTTVVHCADLHITTGEDRDYSFAVLEEIIDVVREREASLLLICGDLFDRFAALRELREEFRSRIARITDACRVVYVVGNHEPHGSEGSRVSSMDLGRVVTVEGEPWQLLTEKGIELLCIPHRSSYDGYREWAVPQKQAPVRIALAHGLVTDMGVYAGPEGVDDDAGAIDPDLFSYHQVDYAALGHIHRPLSRAFGSVVAVYAGSARVFREGESGPHGVEVLRVAETVERERVELRTAGQYRYREFPLAFDGTLSGLDTWADEWGASDLVEIGLSGIVEDENQVRALEQRIRGDYADTVRSLRVDRSRVDVLEGIAGHDLARRFQAAWESARPEPGSPDESLWLRARMTGLRELCSLVRRST